MERLLDWLQELGPTAGPLVGGVLIALIGVVGTFLVGFILLLFW
jgi:hypothetical protein